MDIIKVTNLVKTYRSGDSVLKVLDNLSYSFEEGHTYTISGDSGSGKSTFLNILGALDNPDRGSVLSTGIELVGANEKKITQYRNQSIGFIFQFHHLLKDFNAIENIIMPGRIAGRPYKELIEQGHSLLKKIDLEERAFHYPSQLSGGERQRIALARALINTPPILLADEPTGSLDEKNSRLVEDLLFSLVKEFKTTLILVSHDPKICQRGEFPLYLREGTFVN